MQDLEQIGSMLQVDHFDWGNDLLVNLFPLWKENILCDTTIICENDEKVEAHSILLAAASPSLYSFLRNSEQGNYEFKCSTVPRSVWKNVVTFIYTGRLDIPKEEMVPTYNLANKLAMFNFCKQLATRLKEHGLIRGGSVKTPDPSVSGESEKDKEEVDKQDSEEKQTSVTTDTHSASNPSSTSNNAEHSPDFLSMDLVSDEAYIACSDFDMDVNVMSEGSEEAGGVFNHRYECPICFLNFKRHSALKKHRTVCVGKVASKMPPPQQASLKNVSLQKMNKVTSKMPPPQQTSLKNVSPLNISSNTQTPSTTSKSAPPVSREKPPEKEESVSEKIKKQLCYKNLFHRTEDGKYQCSQCTTVAKRSYQGITSHIKVKHMGLPIRRPKKVTTHQQKPREEVVSGQVVPGQVVPGGGEDVVGTMLPDLRRYYVPVSNHAYYKMKCKDCGKLLRNRASFVMHVKLQHLHNQQRVEMMGKITDKVGRSTGGSVGSGTLSGHPKVRRPRKEVYECHLCGRTFYMKMHLGSHMRSHTAEGKIFRPTQTKRIKVSKLYKKIEIKK